MESERKRLKDKHLRRPKTTNQKKANVKRGKCEKEPMVIQGESMKTVCRAERTE